MGFLAFLLSTYIAAPLTIIAGWRRWWVQRHRFEKPWLLPGASLALASSSALLACAAISYANFIHGFAYYAPSLMRIYGVGSLLSTLGLLIGIGGLWIKSPVQWLAPLASLSTLLYWFLMAGME